MNREPNFDPMTPPEMDFVIDVVVCDYDSVGGYTYDWQGPNGLTIIASQFLEDAHKPDGLIVDFPFMQLGPYPCRIIGVSRVNRDYYYVERLDAPVTYEEKPAPPLNYPSPALALSA